MNASEKLAKAREFSPGISEWIDLQLKRGMKPDDVVETLRLTTALAIMQRKMNEAK